MGLNYEEVIEDVLSNPGKKLRAASVADSPRETGQEIADRFPKLWPDPHHDPEQINWLRTFRNKYIDTACLINAVVKDHREKSLALTSLEDAYNRTVRAILA